MTDNTNGLAETLPPTTENISEALHELRTALLRIEQALQDTPRRGEVYTREEIDAMVMERNAKLEAVESQLSSDRHNNEELVNRLGANIQQRIDSFDAKFNNALRGFTDTQATQQRNIDTVINSQKETNAQIQQLNQSVAVALNAINAWTTINETTQQQMRSVDTRMGQIEEEERSASDERTEINRRFELMTNITGQVKTQMTTLSNDVLSAFAQLKIVTDYMRSEQARREITRKRWEYIKKMLTSKPVVAILYPIATPLLGWIGVQIGDQLKLQEFVQTVLTFLEQLTGSL